MGKRTRLLATVALPIASLVWQPVQAAPVRPVVAIDHASAVVTVQAEGGASEEELLRKRKKQREERQDDRQKTREERRQKQRDSAEGEQRQQDRQKAREERRERQRDAAEGEQRQKTREERREKQRDAAEQEQRQQDRQKAREERREKQRGAAEKEQRQDDRQKARQERREKQRDAAEKEQRQEEQRQKARDEKRQKERDAAEKAKERDAKRDAAEKRERQEDRKAQDAKSKRDRTTAIKEEEQRKAEEAKRKKEREAAEADRKRGEEDAGNRPRRKRDVERERIARDPSKTSDTIELPYERGTAVLDSDKDADNRRDRSRDETRRKRAEERAKVRVRVPRSDADAQIGRRAERYESVERERGERRDRRPEFENRGGWRVERRVDDRQVINFNDRIIVRSDDSRRLSRQARETYYEELPRGRVREVIVRPNGDRVVTIRDRYGEIIQRSRIDRSGREYVMFYAPEIDRESRPTFVDPGLRLPPMRLAVPLDDYIADTSSEAPRDYREFLERPPVEEVERVYTLDEVKYSARIRDKVRRIDLDTITFATGSADVSMNQAATLRKVADAINQILDEDPGETFLIEGHTDAVGSEESNLVLSDERAESVADILTDAYGIPPENLATQGYGERFLKIATDGPEQLNRRVTIRRVTPLVKPVAMAQ
ncbi:OmpA family protein [Shinella pollutisoli]|uniref:OmpA family protein n=1 Tax=Shinella pollutisoli TaxID=2250594 RepID=A0ABV7DF60_9HYPH|nr:OmpA family protein [Shinella pollutisoli]